MRFTLKTAGTFDAISLADARLHLKEPSNITAEDDLIKEFIVGAGAMVQTKTHRVISSSTWTGRLDAWPSDNIITINKVPITSITSVKYYNDSNVLTTLTEGTDYIVDTEDETRNDVFRIFMINSPTLYDRINGIEIEFVAGYSSQTTVDSRIKQAVKLFLTDWKENRTDYVTGKIVSVLPRTVEYLLNQIRTDEF